MGYYPTFKSQGSLIFLTTWMNLDEYWGTENKADTKRQKKTHKILLIDGI